MDVRPGDDLSGQKRPNSPPRLGSEFDTDIASPPEPKRREIFPGGDVSDLSDDMSDTVHGVPRSGAAAMASPPVPESSDNRIPPPIPAFPALPPDTSAAAHNTDGQGSSSADDGAGDASSGGKLPRRRNARPTASSSVSPPDNTMTLRKKEPHGGATTGGMPGATSKSCESRRATCHRCANVRRRNVQCSRCPRVACEVCAVRWIQAFGVDAFTDGCPVCKLLCCCSDPPTASRCDRLFHCNRRVSGIVFVVQFVQCCCRGVCMECAPHLMRLQCPALKNTAGVATPSGSFAGALTSPSPALMRVQPAEAAAIVQGLIVGPIRSGTLPSSVLQVYNDPEKRLASGRWAHTREWQSDLGAAVIVRSPSRRVDGRQRTASMAESLYSHDDGRTATPSDMTRNTTSAIATRNRGRTPPTREASAPPASSQRALPTVPPPPPLPPLPASTADQRGGRASGRARKAAQNAPAGQGSGSAGVARAHHPVPQYFPGPGYAWPPAALPDGHAPPPGMHSTLIMNGAPPAIPPHNSYVSQMQPVHTTHGASYLTPIMMPPAFEPFYMSFPSGVFASRVAHVPSRESSKVRLRDASEQPMYSDSPHNLRPLGAPHRGSLPSVSSALENAQAPTFAGDASPAFGIEDGSDEGGDDGDLMVPPPLPVSDEPAAGVEAEQTFVITSRQTKPPPVTNKSSTLGVNTARPTIALTDVIGSDGGILSPCDSEMSAGRNLLGLSTAVVGALSSRSTRSVAKAVVMLAEPVVKPPLIVEAAPSTASTRLWTGATSAEPSLTPNPPEHGQENEYDDAAETTFTVKAEGPHPPHQQQHASSSHISEAAAPHINITVTAFAAGGGPYGSMGAAAAADGNGWVGTPSNWLNGRANLP